MASDIPVVLITGSERRIGRAVAARLADAYTVVGIERDCTGDDCVSADITSEDALAAALATLRERFGRGSPRSSTRAAPLRLPRAVL